MFRRIRYAEQFFVQGDAACVFLREQAFLHENAHVCFAGLADTVSEPWNGIELRSLFEGDELSVAACITHVGESELVNLPFSELHRVQHGRMYALD